MEEVIGVQNLVKVFKTFRRGTGFVNAARDLFLRHYEDVVAVNSISFSLGRGEIVGFLGPNGAGKTTTIKMLSGILYPSSGKVEVLGYVPWRDRTEYCRHISTVFGQRGQLWYDLPAMDTFMLNKYLYGLSDREFKDRLEELDRILNLKEIWDIPVRELSMGMRMKCELTASLLHGPDVLFLDEPTIGLDFVAAERIKSYIKKVVEQAKMTVILTSHNMRDVEDLCKRLIVINKGSIVYDGSLDELRRRFASRIKLRLTLANEASGSAFADLGGVFDAESGVVELEVDRQSSAQVIGEALSRAKVLDVSIEERSTEDIIKEMYEGRL